MQGGERPLFPVFRTKKDEEKKSPKLVARLIKAPDKVKSYTKQDLHRIVNEAVELAKGKI